MIEKTFVWEIIPSETPMIIRNCNKCKQKRKFYCSDAFRINAQQKAVDVWLIYKCSNCDTTWNMAIYSRCHPQKIDGKEYKKFMANDKELARDYAFNFELLKRNQAEVEYDVKYDIVGQNLGNDIQNGIFKIQLNSPYSFNLRLDKVLKSKFNISRNVLYKMIDSGILASEEGINIKKYKIKRDLNFIIDGQRMNEIWSNLITDFCIGNI